MVGATFNYSATIWSLARALIGLLLAISSGVATMANEAGDVGLGGGEIYDTGRALGWEGVGGG